MTPASPLIISNLAAGDTTFDSEVGSWNVSCALRDCQAGKHRIWLVSTAAQLWASRFVEFDKAKVDALIVAIRAGQQLPPLICICEGGQRYLIDGIHRLHALAWTGHCDFRAYVIEEADAAPYQILFNGSRIAPPWLLKQLVAAP